VGRLSEQTFRNTQAIAVIATRLDAELFSSTIQEANETLEADFSGKLLVTWWTLATQQVGPDHCWGHPISIDAIYSEGFTDMDKEEFLDQIANLDREWLELIPSRHHKNYQVGDRRAWSLTFFNTAQDQLDPPRKASEELDPACLPLDEDATLEGSLAAENSKREMTMEEAAALIGCTPHVLRRARQEGRTPFQLTDDSGNAWVATPSGNRRGQTVLWNVWLEEPSTV
jgi:hypothetical protein